MPVAATSARPLQAHMRAHPEQAGADHPYAAALTDADLSMHILLEVALLGTFPPALLRRSVCDLVEYGCVPNGASLSHPSTFYTFSRLEAWNAEELMGFWTALYRARLHPIGALPHTVGGYRPQQRVKPCDPSSTFG